MSSDAATESTGLFDLIVARALWKLQSDEAPTAIDAATRALVEGQDSGPLRELAGVAPDINVFELGALIESALTWAGVDVGELTEDDALHLVTRHHVERVLRGEMDIRELTGWAHYKIGHEGPAWAQDLVDLDDRYDGFASGWGEKPNCVPTLERYLMTSQPALRKWERHVR
ncbi:hypothetical protein [Agromyces sp. NPDC057865]|uniref:hypothetical protein n=1 Tax=Agromyces sp. NPDC057865 TaxID=3346267 RepID=UPI00367241ED